MLKKLNPLLRKRAEELIFIELKPGVQLGWNGFAFPEGTPLPVELREIVGDIKEHNLEHFSSVTLVEGMIRILGIDSETPHRQIYLNALRAYQPDILEVILAKGIHAASEDAFDEAMLLFRTALQLAPDHEDALYNYGRSLADLAEKHEGTRLENALIDEAIEVFETLAALDPELAEAHYQLGFLYANKKAYIKASDCWLRALTLELTEDQVMEIRTLLIQLEDKRIYEEGYNAVLKGYNQEALELLSSLEEKYPEWWNLFFFIGLAYKGLEQYEDAISCFLRVEQLHPGHPETQNELAICYMMLMRYQDAEEHLAKGIGLNPESAEMLCNMGIIQREKGNLELAEKFLIEAVQKAPEDELSKAWLEKVRNDKRLREPLAEQLN